MPFPSRRTMIFRSPAGGTAALVASAAAWIRPAEAAQETAATVLAGTGSIPVGGGKIIKGRWVVTQPAWSSFRAFSAVCTHQGRHGR